jgi:hypothetical protein
MPSRAYELFLEAMRQRQQVTCTYRGKRRELCPIILGHTGGAEKALTFQFAGESSTQLPPGGEWRCLTLADVGSVELRDGSWHASAGHSLAQTCVTEVDYDVNPQSPYAPRYRL